MATAQRSRHGSPTWVRRWANGCSRGIPVTADLLVAGGLLAAFSRPLLHQVLVAYLLLAALGGAYGRSVRVRLADVAASVGSRLAVAAVAVGALAPGAAAVGDLIRVGPAAAVAFVLGRLVAGHLARLLRNRGNRPTRAIIVGAGRVGIAVADGLRTRGPRGIQPLGFVDDVADDDLPLPLLGRPDELGQLVVDHCADVVIIAYGLVREPDLVSILRACEHADIDLYVVPRFYELGHPKGDEVWGIPLQPVRLPALSPAAQRAKRAFDMTVASAMLLVASPLLFTLALLVKLTSRGPVFFRQERVGQGGRHFDVLKFRTMQPNHDQATTWDVTSDARVTPLGRVLRRTSLDELPQLLNVLAGDMSLVGPRPERPYFVDQFARSVPGYRERHRAPVGITGLAQVNGLRGDTSIADRAMFDNLYIDRWSFTGDLVILLRTVWAVVRPPASVIVKPAMVEPVIDLRDDEPVIDLRAAEALAAEVPVDAGRGGMPRIAAAGGALDG